jgi:hypothetical protein
MTIDAAVKSRKRPEMKYRIVTALGSILTDGSELEFPISLGALPH